MPRYSGCPPSSRQATVNALLVLVDGFSKIREITLYSNIKTIGKIVTFPVTGPLKVMRAFVEFLLHEDAADAEFVEDTDKNEEE